MTLNRYRLRHLKNRGHAGAIRAHELLQRPDRLIGLIIPNDHYRPTYWGRGSHSSCHWDIDLGYSDICRSCP